MKTGLQQVMLSVALTSVIVLGGGDVLGLTDGQTVLAYQGNALQNTAQSAQAKVKESFDKKCAQTTSGLLDNATPQVQQQAQPASQGYAVDGHNGTNFAPEAGQKKKPSAQVGGQGSGLMVDGAAEWIARHPFTYDDSKTLDENIADAEKLTKEFLDTFGETDRINTPERQRLRKKIADELYGEGAKTKNREVFLIVGHPAAGKSTLADLLIAEQGALLVDSDEAKKRLPEFSKGLLSAAVHAESSNIADNVLARAIENGDNIVMPIVGKTYDHLKERVDKFKEAGYTVKLIYIDLPLPKAIERVKKRFKETGRLIKDFPFCRTIAKPRK